jgi:hypothetical protein
MYEGKVLGLEKLQGALLDHKGIVKALTLGIVISVTHKPGIKNTTSPGLPTWLLQSDLQVGFTAYVLNRFFGSTPPVCLLYRI